MYRRSAQEWSGVLTGSIQPGSELQFEVQVFNIDPPAVRIGWEVRIE